MLKPFKQNVFRLQPTERFMCGSDAAFCQIILTTRYFYYHTTKHYCCTVLLITLSAHGILLQQTQ